MYVEEFPSAAVPFPRPPQDTHRADLPREAPIDMPVQDLGAAPDLAGVAIETQPEGMFQRRLFLVAGSFTLGLAAAQEMVGPLAVDGIDLLDSLFFLLFFGLFGWIGFGFLNAIAGFAVMLGTGPGMPRWLAQARLPNKRTAVLVPIYNEDIAAVSRRLRAMADSVVRVGGAELFDFFVLSDSHARNEAAERRAFRALRATSRVPIYYRRRERNTARKPGNIAEWVRRFGGAYAHMIVLDADSLMSGAAMARLAAAMEARPRVGLLQTIPSIINGRTFFARWNQFAAVAYGSVASAGMQWWSGSEATFWGHNAIVRVAAFAESCGLPMLTGREPFGGYVLSHDMVEAALLRRRGWAVHMVMLPEGSYEEFPPTLIDHAVRDRRWCQGNLQHLRLLGTAGFHWVSRLQLLMGASAFLTSPWWLLLLAIGLVEPLRASGAGAALLPSAWLLVLTFILLVGPRLIALLWLGVDRRLREALGGTRRVIATVLLEIPLSAFVAPLTMVTQTMAIIDILRGRPSGWATQRREADGLSAADAFQHYRWHMALGAVCAAAILAGMEGAWWTAPVAISLLAAPATAMLTSRADVGLWLQRKGLFLTPQESAVAGDQPVAADDPARFLPETSWSRMFLASRTLRLLNP
ncbi:MAG TPA: glucans biosynthesis glucosyltransferase MdoH [Sphingomonadaceae bacterium]|nr:glucans biosynthesis glucosyltransferase MdoH [Sphingomonadaceae bacterium]